jgi:ABC-type nickel/cobalt efflux system permease component RcnA
VLWAREKQQAFYGKLSATLRQMRGNSPLAATWALMLLSFGYGVFHAAGPGHGKAVISAWLLATENDLRRGILISFLSALIQALTAIVLVGVLFLVVASVGSAARDMAGLLESASYALIALLGGYLVWTALGMLRPVKAEPAPVPAFAGVTTRQSIVLHDFAGFEPKTSGAAPAADHVHGPDCGCGHAHLPAASELRGDWSLAKAFSIAFAVGIRPCTGAILVLVFANGLGLYWAGVLSTLAMAVGTFITVSLIAAFAVYSKKLAARLLRGQSRLLDWFGIGLRFAGGLAIAFLGTILFLGSLGTTNAMM